MDYLARVVTVLLLLLKFFGGGIIIVMSETTKIFLTHDRYHEKRYEITKEILTALVGTVDLDIIKAKKQRETMVFYSLQLADDLMQGLNYTVSQAGNNNQTINSLADLMRANEKNDKKEE